MENCKNIHVVVDARSLDGRVNGIARVVRNFLLNLPADINYRVTAISNNKINFKHELCSKFEVYEDVGYSKIPGTLWLMFRLPFLLKRIGATHFVGMAHILPILKFNGIKYAVLMHDLVHLLYPSTMQFTNRLVSKLLFGHSYRTADVVATVSRSTMNDLKFHLGVRDIFVVYPGTSFINSKIFTKEIKNSEIKQLLFVGSMEPRKNLQALLDSFAVLNMYVHTTDLTICSGNSWAADSIQSCIAGYQGLGNITLLKSVSDLELSTLYECCDALVLPSIYEGFGLPIVEASGKIAVIANDIAVFRELAEYLLNIKFVDFSQNTHDVAYQLNDALASCQIVRFRNDVGNLNLFEWKDFSARLLKVVISN